LYLEYWGLSDKPFENTPDPRFFYSSQMHQEALNRILYGVTNNKGCVLLTGEYGCGKTAMLRKLIESLDPDRFELALLNYPIFSASEFLREVLFQYGADNSAGSKLELFHRISTFGFDNLKLGKQNLLMIDEAQLIEDADIYEQMRLLLNLQLEDQGLLTLFLVGQPELRDRIMMYPQLDQRIGIRYHLHYFAEDDVAGYIRHRMMIAGGTRDVFAPEAISMIAKISHGIPRRINNMCDLSLLEGMIMRAQLVDEAVVKRSQ
jgi:general secretion pathway protein A